MADSATYTFEEIEDALRAVLPDYDDRKAEDSFGLALYIDQACLKCFREDRPRDRHVEVLRAASRDMTRKGLLLCDFPANLPFSR